ncbi:MAG: vitamin K epoxide reductase family protein [Streptosporangiaceae bacterium]
MANQNRRPNSTQTARKGAQSRRSQPAAGSASSAAARTPAASATPRAQGGQGPVKSRPVNGKAAGPAPAGGGWTPRWVRMATLGLSLIGLGLGIYLTIAHLAGAQILACSSKGLVNCEAVTTSPESELFGIFPVAELGLAFYVFMTVINLPWFWRPEWRWLPARGPLASARRQALPVIAWRVRLGSMIIGVLFILYLVYTELITLREICLWCTYVHITTFLLFVVIMAQATLWGSPSKLTADSTARRPVR